MKGSLRASLWITAILAAFSVTILALRHTSARLRRPVLAKAGAV